MQIFCRSGAGVSHLKKFGSAKLNLIKEVLVRFLSNLDLGFLFSSED